MGRLETTFSSEPPEHIDSTGRPSIIEIRAITRLIGRHRGLFFGSICLFLGLAVTYLHVVPHRYSVSLQIAPVTNTESELTSRLGALGSLAGFNFDQLAGPRPFELFQEGLKSRAAADAIASNPQLMHRLFAREWSPVEGRWREPTSAIRPLVHALLGVLGIPEKPWAPPSGEDVYQLLQRQVDVVQDIKSPVITVTVSQIDPSTGVVFLRTLDDVVDRMLRQRALERAEQYIAYLTDQLNRVTITDYRQALIENLIQQEKNRMMASAAVSFVGDAFSGPTVSRFPTSPNVPLTLALALFVGTATGLWASARADSRFKRADSKSAVNAHQPM